MPQATERIPLLLNFSRVALPFQECRPKFLLFWLVVNAVGVLASAAYFIYLVVIYSTAGAEGAAGKNFLINLLRESEFLLGTVLSRWLD